MAWSDEDDDLQDSPYEDARSARHNRSNRPGDSWDADAPDSADLVPDEMTTVRCAQCKKLIFEDSVSCPYCHHLQMADERDKKPRWFLLTAFLCLFLIAGYLLLSILNFFHWIHR